MGKKKEEVLIQDELVPQDAATETPTEAPVETVEEVVDETPKVAQVVTLGQRNKARQ